MIRKLLICDLIGSVIGLVLLWWLSHLDLWSVDAVADRVRAATEAAYSSLFTLRLER